ncbi:hypothetical protein GEMRC1_004621 [Eukaryota sp. GEM-RC1]
MILVFVLFLYLVQSSIVLLLSDILPPFDDEPDNVFYLSPSSDSHFCQTLSTRQPPSLLRSSLLKFTLPTASGVLFFNHQLHCFHDSAGCVDLSPGLLGHCFRNDEALPTWQSSSLENFKFLSNILKQNVLLNQQVADSTNNSVLQFLKSFKYLYENLYDISNDEFDSISNISYFFEQFPLLQSLHDCQSKVELRSLLSLNLLTLFSRCKSSIISESEFWSGIESIKSDLLSLDQDRWITNLIKIVNSFEHLMFDLNLFDLSFTFPEKFPEFLSTEIFPELLTEYPQFSNSSNFLFQNIQIYQKSSLDGSYFHFLPYNPTVFPLKELISATKPKQILVSVSFSNILESHVRSHDTCLSGFVFDHQSQSCLPSAIGSYSYSDGIPRLCPPLVSRRAVVTEPGGWPGVSIDGKVYPLNGTCPFQCLSRKVIVGVNNDDVIDCVELPYGFYREGDDIVECRRYVDQIYLENLEIDEICQYYPSFHHLLIPPIESNFTIFKFSLNTSGIDGKTESFFDRNSLAQSILTVINHDDDTVVLSVVIFQRKLFLFAKTAFRILEISNFLNASPILTFEVFYNDVLEVSINSIIVLTDICPQYLNLFNNSSNLFLVGGPLLFPKDLEVYSLFQIHDLPFSAVVPLQSNSESESDCFFDLFFIGGDTFRFHTNIVPNILNNLVSSVKNSLAFTTSEVYAFPSIFVISADNLKSSEIIIYGSVANFEKATNLQSSKFICESSYCQISSSFSSILYISVHYENFNGNNDFQLFQLFDYVTEENFKVSTVFDSGRNTYYIFPQISDITFQCSYTRSSVLQHLNISGIFSSCICPKFLCIRTLKCQDFLTYDSPEPKIKFAQIFKQLEFSICFDLHSDRSVFSFVEIEIMNEIFHFNFSSNCHTITIDVSTYTITSATTSIFKIFSYFFDGTFPFTSTTPFLVLPPLPALQVFPPSGSLLKAPTTISFSFTSSVDDFDDVTWFFDDVDVCWELGDRHVTNTSSCGSLVVSSSGEVSISAFKYGYEPSERVLVTYHTDFNRILKEDFLLQFNISKLLSLFAAIFLGIFISMVLHRLIRTKLKFLHLKRKELIESITSINNQQSDNQSTTVDSAIVCFLCDSNASFNCHTCSENISNKFLFCFACFTEFHTCFKERHVATRRPFCDTCGDATNILNTCGFCHLNQCSTCQYSSIPNECASHFSNVHNAHLCEVCASEEQILKCQYCGFDHLCVTCDSMLHSKNRNSHHIRELNH